MGLIRYFWDSYAIIELIKGNPRYAQYSHEPIKICIFNLVEIYWFALNEYGEEKANQIFNKLKNCVLEVDDETLKEAIKFRKKVYDKNKISYADAIGYLTAIKNDMIFLTGDKDFRGIEKNVEFVSKN